MGESTPEVPHRVIMEFLCIPSEENFKRILKDWHGILTYLLTWEEIRKSVGKKVQKRIFQGVKVPQKSSFWKNRSSGLQGRKVLGWKRLRCCPRNEDAKHLPRKHSPARHTGFWGRHTWAVLSVDWPPGVAPPRHNSSLTRLRLDGPPPRFVHTVSVPKTATYLAIYLHLTVHFLYHIHKTQV